MTSEDNFWRTQAFRQHVALKIFDTIQRSRICLPVSNVLIEEYIFQKAKDKEMYLATVARLILHIRKISDERGRTENVAVDDGMQDITDAFQKLFMPDQQCQEPLRSPTPVQGIAPPTTEGSMEEE